MLAGDIVKISIFGVERVGAVGVILVLIRTRTVPKWVEQVNYECDSSYHMIVF